MDNISNLEQKLEKDFQKEKETMFNVRSEEDLKRLTKLANTPEVIYYLFVFGFLGFVAISIVLFMSSLGLNEASFSFWKLFASGVSGYLSCLSLRSGFRLEEKAKEASQILKNEVHISEEEKENLTLLLGLSLKHPYVSSSFLPVLNKLYSFLKDDKGNQGFWSALKPSLEKLKKEYDKRWLATDTLVAVVSEEKECAEKSTICARMVF